MIIEFESWINEKSSEQYDVCIIGAGAMGIALALDLQKYENKRVLLLEQGGYDTRPAKDGDVGNTGEIKSGLSGSHARGLGGSTTLWGGQALPFDAIDFAERPWVPNKSCPVSENELAAFYDRAEALFGVDKVPFTKDINQLTLSKTGKLKQGFSKFSPVPSFLTKFSETLSQAENVDVVLNAKVSELVGSELEGLQTVRFVSGAKRAAMATHYVLACGGIATPELLLASPSLPINRLVVGRYYQDHIGVYGAKLTPINHGKFQQLFATRVCDGIKCLPKLSLSESAQREHLTLNVTANIEVQTAAQSPLNMMRLLYNQGANREFNQRFYSTLWQLLKSPREAFLGLYEIIINKRILIPKNAEYFLVANIESKPIVDSRVTLNKIESKRSIYKPTINWLVDDMSRRTALIYYQAVKSELEEAGIAKVVIKKELTVASYAWREHCYALYHHMGATRMSGSPSDGVVDPNCKVYGLDNLYIAGPSILPTTSSSNPTFTALAFALRLSSHLSQGHY